MTDLVVARSMPSMETTAYALKIFFVCFVITLLYFKFLGLFGSFKILYVYIILPALCFKYRSLAFYTAGFVIW